MFLIHQRFTRLQSAINFDSVRLSAPATLPDHLPEVPERWTAFHSPALVAEVDRRLTHLIAHPTETEHHKSGQRRVQVLGDAIYDIAPDGTVQAALWGFDWEHMLYLEEVPDDQITADGAPLGSLWFEGYEKGILRSLRRGHVRQQYPELERYVRWLRQCLLEHHWTPAKAAWVRAEVAVALNLDVEALDRARKLYLIYSRPLTQPVPVRLSHYNHALRRREVDERLLRESPQLAVLHSLLALQLNDHGERTQQMRDFLLRQHVTPAMWALIQQVGSRWMLEFIAYYGPRVPLHQCACDVLLLAQAFGTDTLVEPVLLHGLMTLGGHPNNPCSRADFSRRLRDLFDLATRLGLLYRRADAAEQTLLKNWVHAIVNWADTEWKHFGVRSRQQLTTAGLIRRVKEFWKQKELELQGAKSWNMPWSLESTLPDLTCHLLRSPLEVWHESKVMHHCAASYIDRCASGSYLIVAIRSRDGGRPVTTVGIARQDQGFRLGMVTGFANRLVSPELKELALDCVEQLNRQWRQQQVAEQEMVPGPLPKAA